MANYRRQGHTLVLIFLRSGGDIVDSTDHATRQLEHQKEIMTEDILKQYRILEIEPDASVDEIKQAFREQVKVWHPDRFPNDAKLQQKANEKLKRINEAYQKIVARRVVHQADQDAGAIVSGIKVGRFVYFEGLMDEIISPDARDGSSAEIFKVTEDLLKWSVEFARKWRSVSVSLRKRITNRFRNSVRARADFKNRCLYLSLEGDLELDVIAFHLSVIHLRDVMGSQRQLIHSALKTAGWDGCEECAGKSYLKAEQSVCSSASADFIRRITTDRNKRESLSEWWGDAKSFWKPANIHDYARVLGGKLLNDAPSSQWLGNKRD